MGSYLHLSGKHAKAVMASHKHGSKIGLHIKGRITSMETRDSMDSMVGPGDGKKSKSAPSHHIAIDVENAGESGPSDESDK